MKESKSNNKNLNKKDSPKIIIGKDTTISEEYLENSKKEVVGAIKRNILRKKYRPSINLNGIKDE